MHSTRWFGVVTILLAGVVVSGCSTGPGRYAVSGTVNYKGQALKAGVISFIPEGSESVTGGAPIQDGKFEIPKVSGLLAGKYKVAISAPEGGPPPKDEMPGISVEPRETIPPRYNRQTELNAEVKTSGSNTFTFDLK